MTSTAGDPGRSLPDAPVELEELRKTFVQTKRRGFRRQRTEIVAVDGVSLSVPAGQSVAFIGPNGAGKSTTIKMLTGILFPTSGRARVLGLTPWQERGTLARHIGVIFGQRSQLWYHLPPRDTFEVLSRVYDLDRAVYARTRDTLIERFGLAPFLARIPDVLITRPFAIVVSDALPTWRCEWCSTGCVCRLRRRRQGEWHRLRYQPSICFPRWSGCRGLGTLHRSG
jgi:hypothetical protein